MFDRAVLISTVSRATWGEEFKLHTCLFRWHLLLSVILSSEHPNLLWIGKNPNKEKGTGPLSTLMTNSKCTQCVDMYHKA